MWARSKCPSRLPGRAFRYHPPSRQWPRGSRRWSRRASRLGFLCRQGAPASRHRTPVLGRDLVSSDGLHAGVVEASMRVLGTSGPSPEAPLPKRTVLVNAALLVMSSALAAGGDVVPAGWGERAPVVVQAGGCCAPAPAPTCCDPCASGGRVKLLDRLRAKFGGKSSMCCDPCANGSARPNLLDKIRARMSKHSCGCGEPQTCCGASPCATGPAVPVTPVTPPKEMPKPKDPKDPKGSGASGVAPSPLPAAPTFGTANPF
jgi:hypothetical protein